MNFSHTELALFKRKGIFIEICSISGLFSELNKLCCFSAFCNHIKYKTDNFSFQMFIWEISSMEKNRIVATVIPIYSHVCKEPPVVTSFFST